MFLEEEVQPTKWIEVMNAGIGITYTWPYYGISNEMKMCNMYTLCGVLINWGLILMGKWHPPFLVISIGRIVS